MLLRVLDLTAPEEPVTPAELKAAARISGPEFDAVLPTNIAAARRVAEQQSGRLLARRNVRVELTDWPCRSQVLPVAPAESCTVTYHDGTSWQSLGTDQFIHTPAGNGSYLAPPASVAWPSLGSAPGARVRIDFTLPAAPCPPEAKLYIIAQAAYWTDNPTASADRRAEPTPFLQHLLDAASVYG